MKAAISVIGGRARCADTPEPPAPSGDELLVRVHAGSLNGSDRHLHHRAGPARLRRGAVVLGFDVAATVIACGPRVTAHVPGDEVVGLLGHSGGGLAEHVLIRQHRVAHAPRGVRAAEAACIPLAGLTALQALHGRGCLSARGRARVLVVGAAGGIGSFAVQLAKLAGAHVTAAARPAKHDFLAGLGADEVTSAGDLSERYDIVVDTPGSVTTRTAHSLLSPNGTLVTTMPLTARTLRGLLGAVFGGPGFTAVTTSARCADLTRLTRLVQEGALRVPVDREFELNDIAAALAHLDSGRAVGKTVITVNGSLPPACPAPPDDRRGTCRGHAET